MAVENRRIASTHLAGMVEHDDLGVERLGTLGRVVLGVSSNVTPTDFLDRDVLHVEADIVARKTLRQLFVVHLDGLDFGGHTRRGKGNDHARLDSTRLDSAHWHGTDTANLVDVLERKPKRLVRRAGGRVNAVDRVQEGLTGGLGLGLLLPTLVPRAVGGRLDHVVAVEARDGHERNGLRVVADLLDEVGRLLDDFVEPTLSPLDSVHLVDGHDKLLDTERIRQKSVLAGLAILGDTGFEFTGARRDDEDGAVGLRGARNHVLDEVTMTRGIWQQ